MKKFTIAIISLLTFFVLSCNNSPKGEAYTIKMRLEQGDSFNNNTKMNMDISMAIPEQPITIKMGIDASVKFDVVEPAGEYKVLKLTYTGMTMKMDMGNKMPTSVNMDSIMN